MRLSSFIKTGIVGILLLAMALPVMAQEKMFIMPYDSDSSWFIYEVDPGDSFKDIMMITNNSDHEQTVEVMAVDAEATASGAFALKSTQGEQLNVGQWLSVEDSVITLESGERKYFQFLVEIPDGIPPGDYAGGLVIIPYEEEEADAASGTGIKTVISVGVRVYVTVSGEVDFDFLWDQYQHSKNVDGEHVFDYQFSNDGNVAVESTGVMRLESAFFDSVEIPLSSGVVYAGESIEPLVAWKNPFPFGPVKATTIVDYSRSNVVGALSDESMMAWSGTYEESLNFWVVPYFELLLTLFVFMGTFGVTYFRTHRVQKFKASCTAYASPVDESLTTIATRYGAPWKLLAKVNGLKFPFMVARGQTILVPNKAGAAAVPVAQPSSPVAPVAAPVASAAVPAQPVAVSTPPQPVSQPNTNNSNISNEKPKQ